MDLKYTHRKITQNSGKSPFSDLTVEQISSIMSSVLADLEWVKTLLDERIRQLQMKEEGSISVTAPEVQSNELSNPYVETICRLNLSSAERVLLVTSLIPYFSSEVFTSRFRDQQNHMKLKYLEFGGFIDPTFMHFVPSLQTSLFILAGGDQTNATFYKTALLSGNLIGEGIVKLSPQRLSNNPNNEINYIPTVESEYIQYLISGIKPRPDFGKAFPATWITTSLSWEQLVLDSHTKNQVEEVMRWVEFGSEMASLNQQFNLSYPCLFYGPPGTGKTLATKLIGKRYNKDVFRVDLSMVVSKYVGETEKNLAYLFDRAAGKDWILFFDEADALFSKRTDVGNANDKWANLEVSYLLQRLEEHRGLTILATNLVDNIEPAMTRRFQSVIYFNRPEEKERYKLWKLSLPHPFSYAKNIDLNKLSGYDFTGANIANVLKDAALSALASKTYELDSEMLSKAIKKEFIKEKRTP